MTPKKLEKKTCADIEREARCCIRYCVHVDLLGLYFGLRQCLRSKRGSEESPNRLQEIPNKPQQALGLAGI